MKHYLAFIFAILSVTILSFIYIFEKPTIAKEEFEKEYKLLDKTYRKDRGSFIHGRSQLYDLGTVDLVFESNIVNHRGCTAYSKGINNYSIWSDVFKRTRQATVSGGNLYVVEKEPINPTINLSFLSPVFGKNLDSICYIGKIDIANGRQIYKEVVSNLGGTTVELTDQFAIVKSLEKKFRKKKAQTVLMDMRRGRFVSIIPPVKKRLKLPKSSQLLTWEKTIKDWSVLDCIQHEKVLYNRTTKKFYNLTDWSFHKIELSNYWVIVYEIEAIPNKIRIAVFDKSTSPKLLGSYSAEGITFDDIAYDDNRLLLHQETKRQQIRLGLPSLQDTAIYINTLSDSQTVPNTTWVYSVIADTLFLDDIASNKQQKLVFEHKPEHIESVRQYEEQWLIDVVRLAKLEQYVIYVADVPTKFL